MAAMLGRVLANQDPDYRRKVLDEWLVAAEGLQRDYDLGLNWQDELHNHGRRYASANFEMGGLEVVVEDLLEALLARCHDTTPVPQVLTKEADNLWAWLSRLHADLSALHDEERRHEQLTERSADLRGRLADLESKVEQEVDHCGGEKQREVLEECLGVASQLQVDYRTALREQIALYKEERSYMRARRKGNIVRDVVAPAAAVPTRTPLLGRERDLWMSFLESMFVQPPQPPQQQQHKPEHADAQLRAKLQDMVNIKLERLACMGRIRQELREECMEQVHQVKAILAASMREQEELHLLLTHYWPTSPCVRDRATSGAKVSTMDQPLGATTPSLGCTDAQKRHELAPLHDDLERTRNQIAALKKLPAEHQATCEGRKLYAQLGETLSQIAALMKLPILGAPEFGVHCTDVLYEAAADMHLHFRDNERRHAAWYEAVRRNEDAMAAWRGACARG